MGKTLLLFKWNCDFLFSLTCSKSCESWVSFVLEFVFISVLRGNGKGK